MSADQSPSSPIEAPSPIPAGSPPDSEIPVVGRPPLSDEQVLLDIAAGHELALMELHRRYARLLYGLGNRMLASPEQVHQAVQDTFVTVWNNAAFYDSTRASVRGWLVSIAHHRFLNLLRGAGGELELHEWFDKVDAPGDQNLQLLALAYYRGESLARLAEISGQSRSSVEQALRQATDQLGSGLEAAPVEAATVPFLTEDQLPESPAFLGPVTEVEPWESPRRAPNSAHPAPTTDSTEEQP